MNADASSRFFQGLPELTRFADAAATELYTEVPADWLIIVTDVRGSTKAIEQGRYRDVNALGAASIIALRNALPHLEVPFVFGGDGATLLVPARERATCEVALRGLEKLATEAFDLELRCGVVPVAALQGAGLRVACARFRVSEHAVLAMFMGDGFAAAERMIKQGDGGDTRVPSAGPAEVDLSGFECRWQPIKSMRGCMLSLLVLASSPEQAQKSRTYREVLAQIEAILGDTSGLPVSPSSLRLRGPLSDFSVEARARSGQKSGQAYDAAFARARKVSSIGKVLRALGGSAWGFDGKTYPLEVMRNCDFRKFDDVLRMVVDVSDTQARAIEALLRRAHEASSLAFGLHRSDTALMTCFVRSFSGDHLHFVDGANGGYALAAKQLKAQLARA